MKFFGWCWAYMTYWMGCLACKISYVLPDAWNDDENSVGFKIGYAFANLYQTVMRWSYNTNEKYGLNVWIESNEGIEIKEKK